MITLNYLDIKPEVKDALEHFQPVVALESTIISHGMPYPQNVEMARKVEQIVRDNGAVPATIAVINGRLKAGLEADELELLANSPEVMKTSRRDLAYVVAKGLTGATTVASTMIVAAMAGIKVFVTGGIGGVHRGAQTSFDISADLQELAKTNVAVVCAGAKSILDIGLTLEYLETMGVPVAGIGTKDFPAFYTRKSGYSCDFQIDDLNVLARMVKSKWDMGLSGGVVVANPIPQEFALEKGQIDAAITAALLECVQNGIKGKETTPFLLAKVKELTGGESLQANLELVYNNARIGAQLAGALSALYH